MPQSPAPSPSSKPHSRWNLLVIALVCAFCSIFLILSFHRLVHHHCCAFRSTTLSRNQVRRRRRLHEDNPDDPSLQFHSQGLDSYIARSLPIVQYRKNNEKDDSPGTGTDCAVCLGEFEEGDWIKHLTNCSHFFHVSCIDIWFQTHSSCPLCRAHIFDIECAYTLQAILTREDFSEEQPSSGRQNHSLNLEREH